MMREYLDFVTLWDEVWLIWYDSEDKPQKRLLTEAEMGEVEHLTLRHEAEMHKLQLRLRDALKLRLGDA